jgi:hypothetical protein
MMGAYEVLRRHRPSKQAPIIGVEERGDQSDAP